MRHAISDVLIAADPLKSPIPVRLTTKEGCKDLLAGLDEAVQAQAAVQDFTGKAGQVLSVFRPDGAPNLVVFGLGAAASLTAMSLRGLPARLPPGLYAYADLPAGLDSGEAALAFALGSYGFDRYKAAHGRDRPRLAVGAEVDLAAAHRVAAACALVRDMVNTPANDMGPHQIETIAHEIAAAHGAKAQVIIGDDLIAAGYPAVHAVGRAATAARAPRMIELTWRGPGADDDAPLLAVIGKGVVFDSGGLDIKPSSGMRWMKKDMGGAAHALALGHLIMGAGLPVRLVVLVPAVENAISADAFRPGDVIASRKGLSIEIGNTDAEGRLILADALARAAELSPSLTIDLATLTGAARVALGPEVIPFYTDDDVLAGEIAAASAALADPLWCMPLWRGYGEAIDSDIADIKNDADAWAQAGSVTAALFLQRFAPETGAWVHLDIFAWNPRNRPGWPMGAEAQAIRALFRVLQDRYGAAPTP